MRKAKRTPKSPGPRRRAGGLLGGMPVLEALEPRQLLSVTISTPLLFTGPAGPTVLDNNPLYDSNPVVGAVQIADDLVMSGTGSITANDPTSPANNSATPIILDVTGNMAMGTGTSIFAENRTSGGSGGEITLTVGGNFSMASGSIISSSRTTTGGSGNGGDLSLAVVGDINLQPGSIVAANDAGGGKAGDILITSSLGTIDIDGLVASGPSTTVLATKLTGQVLAGGNTTQKGGKITIKVLTDIGNTDPTLSRLNVSTDGIIISQGQDPSSDTVLLESQCSGIRIDGLVGSVAAKQHGSIGLTANVPQVILRSPRFIEVNGADLGGSGPNQGRVRADYVVGERSLLPPNPVFGVDMFARSYIDVTGPAAGTVDSNNPTHLPIFAVSSFGGTANNTALFGGTVTAIAVGDTNSPSTQATIVATGNAFDASAPGAKGGKVNLTARDNVVLNGATIAAAGKTVGGQINVRSFNGSLSWQNGVGDVRPTGLGVALASRGKVTLTAPGAPILTGTVFPVSSGAQTNPITVIAPFDAAAQAELALLDVQLNLPLCQGETGDCSPLIDTIITLSGSVTVDFNAPGGPTLTGPGAAILNPFFSWSQPNPADPSTWEAKFNLPYNDELDILDGVVLTTKWVGAGNNEYAPGIEIEAGALLLFPDADNNHDGGGTILVSSWNKAAGHIFIRTGRDIQVNGSVIDEVLGTNGTPGEILLQTHCGNIGVGPLGRVLTKGVDHGGADIVMVDGEEGSTFTGNIFIEGLVRATYKGQAEGVIPTIDIVDFKLPGNIVIDGRNSFQAYEDTGVNGGITKTLTTYTSGVRVQSLRDPLGGTINIQAVNSVTVLGNDNGLLNGNAAALAGAFGTVAVKTASSSPVGGNINVVVLGQANEPGSGTLVATDRAFDNAGKFNKDAKVTLRAAGLIDLEGTTANILAVVDNSGTGSGSRGGTNIIHSYNGPVLVGVTSPVKVLAIGVTPGVDTLVGTPVVMGVGSIVNPANSGSDPAPLAPLFPTMASLDHGLTSWGPWPSF
jgi:hypothetical protein